MQNGNQAIGIFDSGIGGLSVWRVLEEFLPNESFIYFADSKNAPYGIKNKEEILSRSEIITNFLLSQNVKLIVVACNTATAAAIDDLRKKHPDIPFVGMEPAVKPASLMSKTRNIGVLATQGTFNGELFKKNLKKYEPYVSIHYTVGKKLVEFAEEGLIFSDKAKSLISSYIQPMLDNNVDQLVLGCTHFPLYIPVIEELTKGKINIIDPADAIARRTKDLLIENRILNTDSKNSQTSFFTNRNVLTLKNMLKFVGSKHLEKVFYKKL